jgi:hypothetical protein
MLTAYRHPAANRHPTAYRGSWIQDTEGTFPFREAIRRTLIFDYEL